MGEIKVRVNDRIEMDFRKTALSAFGYSKGAISKAAEEAMALWTSDKARRTRKTRAKLPKLELGFTVGDKVIDRILDRVEQEVV